MAAYQKAAGKVIDRYDGHVEQYLGDGIMVYFGWPTAHEDDAERAVRAGLDIVRAVATLEGQESLAVRVGIATGVVVVGQSASGERSSVKAAVGETPNRAARIQSLAAANSVAIGAQTRRLVGGNFELQTLGVQSLKGIAAPIEVFFVTGEADTESRFDAQSGGEMTPLIGRDAEIHLLMDRWEQTLAGEGQLVLLTGEPGIGKSRIVHEVRDRLRGTDHIRLSYQCSPFYADSAFHPIIEQIERAAGFERNDNTDTKLDKLESLLYGTTSEAEKPPLREQTCALYSGLLSLPTDRYPPISLSPQARKDLTLHTLQEQAIKVSARAPVLMVLEDAQWADPTTLETFSAIIQRNAHYPVLIIITFRPEFDPPWTGQPHATPLFLKRLGRAQGADLVAELIGSRTLANELLEQIVAKTDGIPLFVEELTKSLLDAGARSESSSKGEHSAPLLDQAIPSSLRDSLMARLDRLGEVKDVAQIVASIGREFSFPMVAAISSLSEDVLADALRQLVESQILTTRGRPPNTTYGFKHALVRDAAYESLLKSRRQELHEKIAMTMRSPTAGSPDYKAEAIAFHFARAERWTEAIEHFREAAAATADTFAIKEALSLYQRAHDAASRLDINDAAEQIMDIHARRADLFFLVGDFPNSRSEWSKMLAMAETQDDPRTTCSALAGLAAAYMWEEEFDDALAYAEKAASAAKEIDDPELLSSAHNTTGSVQAVTGRLDTGRQQLDKAIHIARSAGSAAQESRALYMRGNIENWQGNYDKAVELTSAGARLAQDNDFTAAFLRSNYANAISLTGKGAYDAALNLFNEGLSLAEKLGDIAFIPRYMNGLGWLHLECQSLERGYDLNQRSAEITRHGGSAIGVEMTAFAETNMADVFLTKGNLDDAHDMLDGVYRICSDPAAHTWMKWRYSSHMFASQARLWLTRGDVRKAGEFAQQCQVIAESTNSQKYVARIWQLQGEIACARKAWPEAEQFFANAVKMAAAIGNPPLMVSTRTALGDFHAAAKRADKATKEYRAAHEVIDRIRRATKSTELRAGLDTAPAFQRIEHLLTRR